MNAWMLVLVLCVSAYASERNAPAEAYCVDGAVEAFVQAQWAADSANQCRQEAMMFYALAKEKWDHQYIQRAERSAKEYYRWAARLYVLADRYYRLMGKIP